MEKLFYGAIVVVGAFLWLPCMVAIWFCSLFMGSDESCSE